MMCVRMNGGRVSESAALIAAGVVLACAGTASADPVFFGPTPYLSSADSPFGAVSFATFHLENFEDGLFNTPGATASAGWSVSSPGPLIDSVDGDDGAIDGSGNGGRSFYSGGQNTVLTITFDAGVLGGLPTHVGIVWTDVGATFGALPEGFGNVIFQAFGPGNVALGSIGPVVMGDGAVTGGTAEDRFFGVSNAAGISSIVVTMPQSGDWEVDHLQYGIAVPGPGALGVVGFLGVVAGLRRRR